MLNIFKVVSGASLFQSVHHLSYYQQPTTHPEETEDAQCSVYEAEHIHMI
jgi:hypothetical protein